MKKLTFIAWVKFDRRSDLVAKHLGADIHYIQVGKRGSIIQAPFRYIAQTIKTWRILIKENPDIVLTQTPPLFAALAIYVYFLFYNGEFVIDAHSATFLYTSWAKMWRVHRFLSRRALITIVPNKYLEEMVRDWGCRASRLGFTPGEYPPGEDYPLDKDVFNVVSICSFSEDEPVAEMLEAARRAPDIALYITGNINRLDPELVASKPANCHFTGYLPEEKYVGLLRGVDAVMDLTSWEYTLLMGGYEAIGLGKPLITSKTETLCEYFPIGTVHVENTAEGILEGMRQAQREIEKLRQEVPRLKESLDNEWATNFTELRQLLLSP